MIGQKCRLFLERESRLTSLPRTRPNFGARGDVDFFRGQLLRIQVNRALVNDVSLFSLSKNSARPADQSNVTSLRAEIVVYVNKASWPVVIHGNNH